MMQPLPFEVCGLVQGLPSYIGMQQKRFYRHMSKKVHNIGNLKSTNIKFWSDQNTISHMFYSGATEAVYCQQQMQGEEQDFSTFFYKLPSVVAVKPFGAGHHLYAQDPEPTCQTECIWYPAPAAGHSLIFIHQI